MLNIQHTRAPKRSQLGTVMIVVVFALPILVGAVTLALSTGELLVKHQQLQDLVDAAALAGAAALRDGRDPVEALTNATGVAVESSTGKFQSAAFPPDMLEVGRYNFVIGAFQPLNTGAEGAPAVRVSLPLSLALTGGATEARKLGMSHLLNEFLGVDQFSQYAESIAVVRPRDFVIAQDITGSFIDEFEFAREADLALVDIIKTAYGGLGDRIGVVTFGRTAQTEFPLTPVAEGVDELEAFLQLTMEVCTSSSSRHRLRNSRDHRFYDPTDPNDTVGRRLRRVNCRGTGTGAAIRQATTMLEAGAARGADPLIILLTDGNPCHVRFGRNSAQWVATGKDDAVDAALAAKERGIRIVVVNLSIPPFGAAGSCSADGSDFNLALASLGDGSSTNDPVDLRVMMENVAEKITVRLAYGGTGEAAR